MALNWYSIVTSTMNVSVMIPIITWRCFWRPIAIAGVTIFGLALIRGIAIWIEAGKPFAHDDCGHNHAPGEDHSHGSGLIYVQVIVLAFPLLLFVWGLPNERISAQRYQDLLGHVKEVDGLTAVAENGAVETSFEELNAAALDSSKRTILEGKRTVLSGKVQKLGEKQFTLFHLKMTCCVADMVTLKTVIVADYAINAIADFKEYRVNGVIQFVEQKGKFTPVIRVANPEEVVSLN